ncbi:MAG: hypothetical protein K6T81_19630 [Alicyclobacillus macrosporangiidus]|nr:hypothetical protein [Alicyclobacillus macrosporangiidus]
MAYETNASNGVISRFVYNCAGLPVLWNYNGKEYGYVYDGLGNIIGLVDDTSTDSTYGTEVVKYTYDAWGNVLTHTDSTNTGLDTANPFIYRGYWYDWDTGLYYLNARYYNPKIGRFLSEDPVAPKVGDAESYNAYSYVRNNPQSFTDPNGRWSSSDTALVAGAVVAGVVTFGIGAVVFDIVALSLAEEAMTGVATEEVEVIGASDLHGVVQNSSRIESNITPKIANQMGRRGWNEDSIHDTVNNPHTTRPATNKANGNRATAYFNEDGSYVVRDNETKDIIQVSDRNDPKWVPDSTIENPYFPHTHWHME